MSTVETKEYSTVIDGERYISIPLATLQLNSILDFSLYLPAAKGAPPLLYRSGDLPFTAKESKRLLEHNIEQLLIKADDGKAYRKYVESNLTTIINDPRLPIEVRSHTLYESAHNLIKEVLEDPRSGDMMERTGNMAQNTVDFLFNQRNSFQALMKVTSYDYYTYTHSVNVFVYSASLAKALGFTEGEVRTLGEGALLHDVGKSRIDTSITNCPGSLNDAQWAEMKMHPVYGYEILKEHGVENEVILAITRSHHEKVTGGGYPDGLKGNEIHPLVRVTTIADIFDALTTKRSYKAAQDSFHTLQFMYDHMSEELDKEYFREFIKLMGSR